MIDLKNKHKINNSSKLRRIKRSYILKYIIFFKIILIFINCLTLYFVNKYNYNLQANGHKILDKIIENNNSQNNRKNENVSKTEIYQNINNKFIEIDNKINISFYEDNIDFSQYSSNIKIIAIYLPNFYSINETLFSDFNSLKFLENIKPKFDGHHQPRIVGKYYLNTYSLDSNIIIKQQIELAKSHGIYGFAIYFYWFSGKTIFEKPINIIYEEQIEFKYMLIWKNEKVVNEKNEVLLEEKYEEIDSEKFIEDIKKYLIDIKYIRIDGKPVIGIYNPIKIPKLNKFILIWRQKAKEFGIGEIFILYRNMERLKDIKIFDGGFKLPPYDLFLKNVIKNTRYNYYYYYGLLYSNIITENKNEIYRGNMLEWDNSPINTKREIFSDYSPELFFILNKKLINWTINNYNESNRLIFINSWNNYYEGTYLEPDSKYGFGSLNSLSKAIFNLPYNNKNYNLFNLQKNCLVAVQAHVYYEKIINEIINKTNNIPVQFDLFITTDTYQKMIFIKNYTEKNSKAKNFFIKIIENKGKDVLPFLNQMSEIIDKYKYFCHIHTKRGRKGSKYEYNWRIHLYKNLLGSSELISEILSDFENNDKLGVIYPENYEKCVHSTMYLSVGYQKYMNYILNKLFPGFKVGNKFFDFPAGDMFWARSEAVYQIFKKDLLNDLDNYGINKVIYAIERIWLFIAKLNGFFYKKYLKYSYKE